MLCLQNSGPSPLQLFGLSIKIWYVYKKNPIDQATPPQHVNGGGSTRDCKFVAQSEGASKVYDEPVA